MARANGGEILIRIPKLASDITASDFDVSIFQKICNELIIKPVTLVANDMVFRFTSVNILKTGCYFALSDNTYDVSLSYADGEITWSYNEI